MQRQILRVILLFGLIGLMRLPAAAQEPVITLANGVQIIDRGVIVENWTSRVVWSPRETMIALPNFPAGETRFAYIFGDEEVAIGEHEVSLTGAGGFAFHPAGDLMAMAYGDAVYLITQNYVHAGQITRLRGKINSIAFHPNGKLLAAAYHSDVHLWDLTSEDTTFFTPDPVGWSRVLSVAFSRNGKWLLTATDRGLVQVWDTSNLTELFRITGASPLAEPEALNPAGSVPVTSAAFSPHNDSLVISLKSLHTIVIIPISDNMPANLVIDPNEAIPASVIYLRGCGTTPVAFNRGGDLLASGDADGSVCVWDIARGELAAKLTGHTNEVLSVGFSRDGRMLASSSRDSTVRLWQIED